MLIVKECPLGSRLAAFSTANFRNFEHVVRPPNSTSVLQKYNNLHHKIKILPRFGLIINLLCQTKSSRKIMPLSFCSKIKNCQKQLTDSFVIQRRLHHEVALGISPRLFDRRAVSRGSKLCIERPSDWLEA